MYINLTPHVINLETEKGATAFPPSGTVARVTVSTEEVPGTEHPTVRSVFGQVEGIPEPQEGVTYITSTLVAQRAHRSDVVSPDTGPTAKRVNGQVEAVSRFQAF